MSGTGTTAAPVTPTPAQEAAAVLHGALATIALELVGAGGGLLTTTLTNIKKKPSIQNVAAQGAVLAISAPLQLPDIEQATISALADAGLQLTAIAEAFAQTSIPNPTPATTG